MRSGDRTVWIAFAAGLVLALITGGAEVLAQGYDEDFETGDFSHWPWETGGTGDEWFVTTDSVHGGLYAARAGAVTPYQYSFLEVEFDCEAGEISFFKRVSCYPCCEARLRFTIDGVEQGSWAGEVDWNATAHSYTVTAGPHAFRWEYRRGETPAGGADTAWLDDINFPPGIVALPPDAPVLDAEPEYTQGTSNTLSWQEANRADECYLKWDTEDSFPSPDGNSGWITSTSDETTGRVGGRRHTWLVP